MRITTPATVYYVSIVRCLVDHFFNEVLVVRVVVVEPCGVFRCRQAKPLGSFVVTPVVEVWLFVEPNPWELLPNTLKINLRTEGNDLIWILGLFPQFDQDTNKVLRVRMSSYHYGDARH